MHELWIDSCKAKEQNGKYGRLLEVELYCKRTIMATKKGGRIMPYFISYLVREDKHSEWKPEEMACQSHPLIIFHGMRYSAPEGKEYRILWWTEISEEEWKFYP